MCFVRSPSEMISKILIPDDPSILRFWFIFMPTGHLDSIGRPALLSLVFLFAAVSHEILGFSAAALMAMEVQGAGIFSFNTL